HYAVQEGARCASVRPSVCTNATSITTYAQSRYFVPGTPPTFTYAAAACGNSVSATVNYALNIGIRQFTIPVSATACYPWSGPRVISMVRDALAYARAQFCRQFEPVSEIKLVFFRKSR